MPGKATPAMNALFKQLEDAGSTGVPITHIRGVAADKTLAGLVRRGKATISFGRAYVVRTPVGPGAA